MQSQRSNDRSTAEQLKKKKSKDNINIYSETSNEVRLSRLLFSLIIQRKPDYTKKPDYQKWAVHIDRMIRIDKRKPDQIESVIQWCQQDGPNGKGRWRGWQNNILSTETLRKKFDRLELDMQTSRNTSKKIKPLERGPDGLTPKESIMKRIAGTGKE